jgi:hypothetical protein
MGGERVKSRKKKPEKSEREAPEKEWANKWHAEELKRPLGALGKQKWMINPLKWCERGEVTESTLRRQKLMWSTSVC